MSMVSYHENMKRGNREFPISFYYINAEHPKYQMIAHWHNDCEIIRVLKGELDLKLNGKILVIKESEAVFIPGNIMHSAEPHDCVYECIVFSKTLFGAAAKCKSKANVLSTARFYDSEDINKLFGLFENISDDDEFMVISLIYKLAYESLKQVNNKIASNKLMYKIKPAINLVEEEYANKILLKDMAEACGISPNYFSKQFKEITGQTPFEYLLAYRIEAACDMLLGETENVTEVCYKCGFNDLSYFIKVFKTHMGISPKNYAINHRV